jgi:hypothetical protein
MHHKVQHMHVGRWGSGPGDAARPGGKLAAAGAGGMRAAGAHPAARGCSPAAASAAAPAAGRCRPSPGLRRAVGPAAGRLLAS